MANQIIVVLVANGSAVNESTYGTFKTNLQTQLDTFNASHPNFQVSIDTNRTQLVEVG